MQDVSRRTRCSDSVQVAEKHGLFHSDMSGGKGSNNRTSLVVVRIEWGHASKALAHALSHLYKGELFLFTRLYPKEASHKKTARFSGSSFLKIVSDTYFNLIQTLDVRDAMECVLISRRTVLWYSSCPQSTSHQGGEMGWSALFSLGREMFSDLILKDTKTFNFLSLLVKSRFAYPRCASLQWNTVRWWS